MNQWSKPLLVTSEAARLALRNLSYLLGGKEQGYAKTGFALALLCTYKNPE